MHSAIVVLDPSGNLPEGQVVEGPERVAKLDASGVVLLPYEPALHGRRGTRGYFRRSWGDGEPLNSAASTRFCPATIDVELGYPWLFWVACVALEGVDPSGQLRLLGDNTLGQQLGASLSAADQTLIQVHEGSRHPMADDGFIVGGRLRISIANPGVLPLTLYGYGRGLRVKWLAVSQAKNVASPAWLQAPSP